MSDTSEKNFEDEYPELELPGVYKEKAAIFAELWVWVQDNVHRINVLKGWRKERNQAEIIALIHSELSEALDALRHGNPPCKKIPEISAVEEELADTIIRIMDLANAHNYDIPKALFLKMEYNKQRPYRHGGKLF
jgi:NTP pyrophosphatase (non-canonical NTP hydrolase)